jgi:hypothetical protein
MKELAKSLTSFSWAMSLYGAQQALRLFGLSRRGAADPATADLGATAPAGAPQLTGPWRSTFEAGDRLQRSAVDMAFDLFTLQALDPNRFAALSADLLRQSTAALRGLLPGGGAASSPRTSAGRGCGEPCGWGPMPPAR